MRLLNYSGQKIFHGQERLKQGGTEEYGKNHRLESDKKSFDEGLSVVQKKRGK